MLKKFPLTLKIRALHKMVNIFNKSLKKQFIFSLICNLNFSALFVCFGSLYNDDLTVSPAQVVPILAAAVHFQLQDLIEQCTEVMINSLNRRNAISYYKAADKYSIDSALDLIIEWFEVNLIYYKTKISFLHQIPPKLMEFLLSRPNLVPKHMETCVYQLLRNW